jgi:tetratricopeptide (TPR) repeat protein
MENLAFIFGWDLAGMASHPVALVFWLFGLWMLVDAVQRDEWIWFVFIILCPPINVILYFFFVYRRHGGGLINVSFGGDQRMIRELEKKILLLDNAAHYLELGDLYFKKGKFSEAEKNYAAALEREPEDLDAKAHYGRCLQEQQRYGEARPLLEDVCMADPRHDFGATLIALGEILTALGESKSAVRIWEQAIEHNSYAQPRVRLAELYLQSGEPDKRDRARLLVEDVLREETLTPAFQQKQEAEWTRRARKVLNLMSRD